MSGIKITPADAALSQCVRERAEWRCERCGSMPDRRGLHASHFHGRGKWSVRFEPMNLSSICHGCHSYFGSHPSEHARFQEVRLGSVKLEILQELANDTTRGRQAKREAKQIAKHYREQLKIMQAARAEGATGWLEFVGYL